MGVISLVIKIYRIFLKSFTSMMYDNYLVNNKTESRTLHIKKHITDDYNDNNNDNGMVTETLPDI